MRLLMATFLLTFSFKFGTAHADMIIVRADLQEIHRYDDGNFIDVVVAAGTRPLDFPNSVELGPDGCIYVSDNTNLAIYQYTYPAGNYLGVFSSGIQITEIRDMSFGSLAVFIAMASLICWIRSLCESTNELTALTADGQRTGYCSNLRTAVPMAPTVLEVVSSSLAAALEREVSIVTRPDLLASEASGQVSAELSSRTLRDDNHASLQQQPSSPPRGHRFVYARL